MFSETPEIWFAICWCCSQPNNLKYHQPSSKAHKRSKILKEKTMIKEATYCAINGLCWHGFMFIVQVHSIHTGHVSTVLLCYGDTGLMWWLEGAWTHHWFRHHVNENKCTRGISLKLNIKKWKIKYEIFSLLHIVINYCKSKSLLCTPQSSYPSPIPRYRLPENILHWARGRIRKKIFRSDRISSVYIVSK